MGFPPKMELSSGGWAPCSTCFLHWVFQEPVCTSAPAAVFVRGCIRLQWIVLKTLSTHSPISQWGQVHLPVLSAPRWVFSSFWPKTAWLPWPTIPIHPTLPQATFLVSPDEKSPQGKHFTEVEEVKQKTAGALKGTKIDKFKNCFEQWKNILIGVLHQAESTLKVTEG